MLPNARIIDARREPMACCFSNLKQLFATGPGIHLQHRGHRPLLPHLPRAHAALGPRAARPGPAGAITRTSSRISRAACAACSISAGWSSSRECVDFHKTAPQRTHRELRAGTPPALPRGSRSVEAFRALARASESGARRCADAATEWRVQHRLRAATIPAHAAAARSTSAAADWSASRLRSRKCRARRSIGALVALVSEGRLSESEQRARSLLERYPRAGMLWKILSVALLRQGKDALPRCAGLPSSCRRMRRPMPILARLCTIGDAGPRRSRALGARSRSIRTTSRRSSMPATRCARSGRSQEAIVLYRRALERQASHVEAQNNLGNALLELGDCDEAARVLRSGARERARQCADTLQSGQCSAAARPSRRGAGLAAVARLSSIRP